MPTLYKQKTFALERSDKTHRVKWLKEQFDRYETYWRPEIERAIRNARMYWQVNFGAWPAYVVEKMRAQGRRPPSFPIIPDKIETLIGAFLSNDFDMRYEPKRNSADKLCFRLQDMWFSDKYQLDWDTSKIACLLDAFIMVGHERMVISDAEDDFGNIAWETCDPTHTLLSPTWKSNYVRDLNDYFTWTNMTAAEIMRHPNFKHNSDHLKELYNREKLEGIDYGQYLGAVPRYKTVEEKWSATHQVIEFHSTEDIVDDYEYDLRNHVWFPDSGFKFGSEDDIEVKKAYYEQQGLSENDVTYLPRKRRVKRIETICPEIDSDFFLQSGKDIIQTNNINLYSLGIRYKGQFQGICDRLYDTQIAYNKGKMDIQDIQSRTAKGAFFIDRALSGGDVELERQIEEAWNDPAARVWVDEGSTRNLAQGGVIPFPQSNVSADFFAENNDYLSLSDRFSKVPAAQDSRTEGSKESGRLFRYKLEVGQIGQKYLMKSYERHEREKAAAYVRQAKITYAGTPRTFRKMGTKEVFWINQPGVELVSGKPVVIDDISLLPEMDVIIAPSKSGINVRTELRAQYSELLDAFSNRPEFGLLTATLGGLILDSQDMPDEAKEQVKNAISLVQRHQAGVLALSIASNEQKLMAMQQAGNIQPQQQQDEEENQPPVIGDGPNQDEGMMRAGTPMENM